MKNNQTDAEILAEEIKSGEDNIVSETVTYLEENRDLIIAVVMFFIIIVGGTIAFNKQNKIIESQDKKIEQAQMTEDYLKAPRIYLETVTEARAEMVRYEEATVNEIESLKVELERIRTDKSVAEMQIRCAREAMYNTELDCNVDFENYPL